MAADVNSSSTSSCCVQWIKRNQKLEKSRNALRQSVKILDGQIEKQVADIASLKKEVEKQQRKSVQQKDELNKVSNINKELVKQIQDMNVKVSSAESTRSLKSIDEDEIGMLKDSILAGQEEIKSLKELLEKERRKNYLERRISEVEKKKAAEAWKLLADEKRKEEEHKFLLVSEKKKAEDLRVSLEQFKAEADEMKEKMDAEIAKAHDEKRKIEVEKSKAYGEKKFAESERKKVEEQKQLIEEEMKMALNVKKHAIHLSQRLEEERKKSVEMQKKLEDEFAITAFGGREHNLFKTLKSAELKLLKERLKLERKRVKHAEKVAKHEKSEKKIVVQEVHFLKRNLIQILYRLNMLDGLISDNMESADAEPETLNYPDLTCFKLNDFLLSKKDGYVPQTEFGPADIGHGPPLTHSEPIGECIGLPVSRRCCSRPKTGINSGLESPVGGSLRHKSQSSAVCSTSIHFSDCKLMGSQGIDSIVENSTGKFEAKHALTLSEFSGVVAQNAMHKGCQVGAKDFDGSTYVKGVKKPRSNSSRSKDVAQVREATSKKRKIDIFVKSVACLHSGESKSNSVIGDKLQVLNESAKNLEQFSLSNCSKNPAAFGNVDYKKIKNIDSIDCTNKKSNINCTNKKGCKSASKYNSDPCLIQNAGPDSSQFDFDKAAASLCSKQSFLKSFENISKGGGCLKLLELDNYSDEVRYMNAMKAPLSPTLPEIEMSNFLLDEVDNSQAFTVKNNLLLGLSDSNTAQHGVLYDITRDTSLIGNNCGSIVSEGSYHARRPQNELERIPFLMETRTGQQRHCVAVEQNEFEPEVLPISKDSNSTFSRGYETSHLPDEIGEFSWQSHSHLFHNVDHKRSSTLGKRHIIAEKGTEHNNQHLLESGLMPEVPHPAFSSQENPLSKSKDEADLGNRLRHFVLSSSASNVECMFRIVCALNAFTSQNLMVSETDRLLVGVLSGSLFEDLHSEEKVAVFFSFFLESLSARISEHCEHIVDGDSFHFLESFSTEISRVISVGKIKCFLDQVFHLNILFHLMEDFLIEREVLVIVDVKQQASSFSAFPCSRFHVNVANNCVLSKDATVSQFIAGCMILASICVAVDDISFLHTFSYKIMHTCQDDIISVLRALHVFANICGKCFFNLGDYSLLVVTISSVVALLEGRKTSVSGLLYQNPNLSPALITDIFPCKQCPFATDALCIDKLIHLLLDALEDYSLGRNDCRKVRNYFLTSLGAVPTRATRGKASCNDEDKLDIGCNVSCAISNYETLSGNLSDGSPEAVLCIFTDIISLVELVDSYMGWDWTCKETISRLLKMVQLCVCEVFSPALVVLLGKLGRHGCSSYGYQHTGIAEMRCKMTELLDALIARKASLPTQIAAVDALLNLIPLNFQDIHNENRDNTSKSCETPCVKNILKWFSQLSGEQQVAVKKIFDEDVPGT